MDIVERLQGMSLMQAMTWVTADKSKRLANIYSEAAGEIERLRLREETLSGIIDGMTARFIEAQKAVEEIERLREEVDELAKERNRYKRVCLKIVGDSKEESDISDFVLYLAKEALKESE